MDNIFGGGGNLGGIQTMGIMNAMKTGNLMLDTAIAMCIPMVFGGIICAINMLKEKINKTNWAKLLGWNRIIHERFIRHSTITNCYGSTTDLGGDSKNELLIKAIQLYLDNHGLLQLKSADLELKSFGEDKQNNYYDYYGGGSSTTLSDTLSKYNVVKKPMKGRWTSLGMFESTQENKQYEVNLVVHEKEDNDKGSDSESKNQRRELTLQFSSEGEESIDSFINKAYTWYLDELRKLEDDSRYMYELITPKKDNDGTNQKYKRYQLSDEKTFDSLFFQQKDNVVGIVDHFVNKTGKYSVKGYPHKLGLLLHGPPGTGKTSLIKVLAQRTGRSIVNVPLARISTNAELASIFFDQKYYVEGEDVPVTLGFKDVIFVMEDIDAVSKIVRRRDGKKTAEVSYNEQVEVPIARSLWRMILESTDESCKELALELINKSERLKKAAHDPQILSASAYRMARVPGLSLIGEIAENDTTRKIAKEAISSVGNLLTDYETIDSFLGKNAQSLKQMLDTGSEISEAFENELLGISLDGAPSLGSFVDLSREADNAIETDDEMMTQNPQDSNDNNDVAIAVESNCAVIGPKMQGAGSSNTGPSSNAYNHKRDLLNLTGILNVLDGVVDTPGRMLIITTNHPEMLDPALVRPGRIDKQLMLGYMAYEDVVLMVEHYFQTSLDTEQVKRIKQAINGCTGRKPLTLSPAQVEQMASEFEEAEDIIVAIENKCSLGPKNRNDIM